MAAESREPRRRRLSSEICGTAGALAGGRKAGSRQAPESLSTPMLLLLLCPSAAAADPAGWPLTRQEMATKRMPVMPLPPTPIRYGSAGRQAAKTHHPEGAELTAHQGSRCPVRCIMGFEQGRRAPQKGGKGRAAAPLADLISAAAAEQLAAAGSHRRR